MNYDNFDIWIEKQRDSRYQVVLYPLSTYDDEYLSDDILSPGLSVKLAEFDQNKSSGAQLEEVGKHLFNSLFRGNILNQFNLAFGKVQDDDSKGLRIRLFIKAREIAALAWELLYHPFKKRFLVTWDKTPVVRYLRFSDGNRQLSINPPVRVLVAIPSFSGLNVIEEERIVRSAFAGLVKNKLAELHFMYDRVSITTITNRLLEKGPFHIFHFIGHGCFQKGDDEGYLMVNPDSKSEESDDPEVLLELEDLERLSAEDFAALFQNHASMKLIVLNSCQGAKVSSTKPLSGVVPKLFAQDIPAVVAMQYPILDAAASRFASQFYRSLCNGFNRGLIDVAITNARHLMHLKGRNELSFATPVLFLRPDSGAIFDLKLNEPELGHTLPIDVTLGVLPAINMQGGGLSTFRWLWHKVADPVRLVSDAPRLASLRETRDKNIEAVKQKKREARNQEELETLDEELVLEQAEVAKIDKRLSGVVGAAMRISRVALTLGFIIFLASTFGLFNLVGIDDYFQGVSSNYLRADVLGGRSFADDQIRIILVDKNRPVDGFPKPNRSADRQFHARMIDALAQAGASVVAIDIFPNGTSPWDSALADSIKRAEQRGTHVIIGTDGVTSTGQPETNIPETLSEALQDRLGNVQVGLNAAGFRPAIRAVALGNEITEGPLRRVSEQGVSVFPSFVLQAIRYFHQGTGARAPEAFFNRQDNSIGLLDDNQKLVRSIPVNDEAMLYYFSPPAENILHGVRQTYQDVYSRFRNGDTLREFSGKIVMVGYDLDADLHYVNGVRQMPGVEIQASVASNILQGISLRRLSKLQNFCVIVVMVALGFVLQAPASQRFSIRLPFEAPVLRKLITIPLPLLAVTLLYLGGIYLIYSRTSWEIEMTYHIAALFSSYWLANFARERSDWIAGLLQHKQPSEKVVEHA